MQYLISTVFIYVFSIKSFTLEFVFRAWPEPHVMSLLINYSFFVCIFTLHLLFVLSLKFKRSDWYSLWELHLGHPVKSIKWLPLGQMHNPYIINYSQSWGLLVGRCLQRKCGLGDRWKTVNSLTNNESNHFC